ERVRHGRIHLEGGIGGGLRVQDPGAVREVVADDQIGVPVPGDVRLDGGVAVPALPVRDQLLRRECGGGQRHARLADEQYRAAAPVVDEQVGPAIFVVVARKAAGGCHRG